MKRIRNRLFGSSGSADESFRDSNVSSLPSSSSGAVTSASTVPPLVQWQPQTGYPEMTAPPLTSIGNQAAAPVPSVSTESTIKNDAAVSSGPVADLTPSHSSVDMPAKLGESAPAAGSTDARLFNETGAPASGGAGGHLGGAAAQPLIPSDASSSLQPSARAASSVSTDAVPASALLTDRSRATTAIEGAHKADAAIGVDTGTDPCCQRC